MIEQMVKIHKDEFRLSACVCGGMMENYSRWCCMGCVKAKKNWDMVKGKPTPEYEVNLEDHTRFIMGEWV